MLGSGLVEFWFSWGFDKRAEHHMWLGIILAHEKCQSFEQEEINLSFYISVYKRLISYITLIHMRDQSCGVTILVLEINLSAFCLIL